MTPEERLRWLKKRPTYPRLAEFFDRIKVVEPVRAAPGGSGPSGTSWMTGATPDRSDDPGVPGGRAELYVRRRAPVGRTQAAGHRGAAPP